MSLLFTEEEQSILKKIGFDFTEKPIHEECYITGNLYGTTIPASIAWDKTDNLPHNFIVKKREIKYVNTGNYCSSYHTQSDNIIYLYKSCNSRNNPPHYAKASASDRHYHYQSYQNGVGEYDNLEDLVSRLTRTRHIQNTKNA